MAFPVSRRTTLSLEVHAVYWGATLLFLLASLAYTAVRRRSSVSPS